MTVPLSLEFTQSEDRLTSQERQTHLQSHAFETIYLSDHVISVSMTMEFHFAPLWLNPPAQVRDYVCVIHNPLSSQE